MQILIVCSSSPLTAREETYWANTIYQGLKELNFDVDMFMLPITQDPLFFPEQMMSYRLMDIQNSCDLLIAIGDPAFVFKHSNKKVLLFSLASSVHEWFDSEYGVLTSPQYSVIRESIHIAEKMGLLEASSIYCASEALTNQISTEFNIKTKTVLLDVEGFTYQNKKSLLEDDHWIICESTLEPSDRIDMLIQALAFSNEKWKLKLFIPSASEVYRLTLLKQINELEIENRIQILDRSISSDDFRKCCGYVNLLYSAIRIPISCLAAAKSNTPMITTTDSGALLEKIHNNINGLIAKPNIKSLSNALDQICSDQELFKLLTNGNSNETSSSITVSSLLRLMVN